VELYGRSTRDSGRESNPLTKAGRLLIGHEDEMAALIKEGFGDKRVLGSAGIRNLHYLARGVDCDVRSAQDLCEGSPITFGIQELAVRKAILEATKATMKGCRLDTLPNRDRAVFALKASSDKQRDDIRMFLDVVVESGVA
jgi:hypothetical protein